MPPSSSMSTRTLHPLNATRHTPGLSHKNLYKLTIYAFSGGEEVLLDVGGDDATEAFEDVGHSDEARELLDGMLIGNLKRQVELTTESFSLVNTNHHAL